MNPTVMIYLVVGAIFGGFSAVVAEAKGYSPFAWFLGGLFFNLVALIAIVGMPGKR